MRYMSPQKRPKTPERLNAKNGRNGQKRPGNMCPIPQRWGIHGNRNISFFYFRNALA